MQVLGGEMVNSYIFLVRIHVSPFVFGVSVAAAYAQLIILNEAIFIARSVEHER